MLAIYFRSAPAIWRAMEDEEKFIWTELEEQLIKIAFRFQDSEKSKIWSQILTSRKQVSIMYLCINYVFLPITEWGGNYKKVLRNWIRRKFTLRYNTPKRLKKQERIRGYRDKGSMSSQSTRARRRANESSTFGKTQEGYNVMDDIISFWENLNGNHKSDSS